MLKNRAIRQILAPLFLVVSLALVGCTQDGDSPQARDKRQEMAENVLRGSTPRDMNQLPKAVQEFRTTFPMGGRTTEASAEECGACETTD